MHLPNYRDGSIVNLMSSIKQSFGGRHQHSRYGKLKILPAKELEGSKNIVLLVIDGLGYNFLKKHAAGTIIGNGLKGKLTSVFPSTTASAITSFATGCAPSEHAITGWFMLLKEIGVVSAILRFSARSGGPAFSANGVSFSDILGCQSFTADLKASAHFIMPREIATSDFTRHIAGKAHIAGYRTLAGFIRQVTRAIRAQRRKFIYGYWPVFDAIAHENGINSAQARTHFAELCSAIASLLERVRGTNTKIIITADHGLIDTPEDRVIDVEEHPRLKECLSLPVCGEPRVAYCYVHAAQARAFEKYVTTRLRNVCSVHRSEELISKKFFGLGLNEKLADRIGDYVLLMKENYVLKDRLLNEKKSRHIGNHGGVSEDEMLVPLIVFDSR